MTNEYLYDLGDGADNWEYWSSATVASDIFSKENDHLFINITELYSTSRRWYSTKTVNLTNETILPLRFELSKTNGDDTVLFDFDLDVSSITGEKYIVFEFKGVVSPSGLRVIVSLENTKNGLSYNNLFYYHNYHGVQYGSLRIYEVKGIVTSYVSPMVTSRRSLL